jgi:hypothetical protein
MRFKSFIKRFPNEIKSEGGWLVVASLAAMIPLPWQRKTC